MQRSRKLSRSGYKIPELYTELESSLISRDLERACGLAAELSCTVGGQTRTVVSFLLDTYCARCVNSGRAQLNLLHSSLAHLGEGTSKSPDVNACHDVVFRRGLCALTLLVACACTTESVEAAFARVPRSEHVPTLASALEALRQATQARDAHSMSSVIRAVPDEPWFSQPRASSPQLDSTPMQELQGLRAAARRDAVWDMWRLAAEMGREVGVSEYVANCLHAFSWNYSSALTARARIHLLWYAFLVIIKGAPRTGAHPIDPAVFERALLSIDMVFAGTLQLPRSEAVVVELETRLGYLSAITRHDPCKAWEVEKDRAEARDRSAQDTRIVDLGLRLRHQRCLAEPRPPATAPAGC